MNIIESHLCGKRPDQSLCEDGYVVTHHFAAVIDGSTSKVKGRNGGKEAMMLVKEAISTLPPEAGKAEMLSALTRVIAHRNPQEALSQAAYRLTCSAVIFSQRRRVVWMVGDCQCRWEGQTHTHPKAVDALLTRVRCEVTHHLLQHGHSAEELRHNDLGRAFILHDLRMQTQFQNDRTPHNPFSYPVLDGTEIDPDKVPELTVPHSTDCIILASDGYPMLCDTLQESEAELARLLLEDPLCIDENAGTKGWTEGNRSFDDRCYLKLYIGHEPNAALCDA